MSVRSGLLAVCCVGVCCVGPAAQEVLVTTIPPGVEGRSIGEALLVDLDGDGVRDLVVQTYVEEADGARYLQVHRGRRGDRTRFRATPDHGPWTLSDRVIAWAVADVDPANRGEEVVLFAREAAITWDWDEGADRPRVARVPAPPFELIWWPSAPTRLLDWQAGVVDVDGDGADDLIVPEPSGYRLLFGSGEGMRDGGRVDAPERLAPEDRAGRGRFEVESGDDGDSLRLGIGDETGEVLTLRSRVPTLRAGHDWDGDGRTDLIAMLDDVDLVVWRDDGGFGGLPIDAFTLPEDWRTSAVDPAWRVLLGELDGRAGADFLVAHSEAPEGKPRTSLGVFLGRGVGGGDASERASRPDQTIRLDGFAVPPQLADIDGDGRVDLVIGSTSPDWMDALRGGSGQGVEGQVRLFLNRPDAESGRLFGRTPSATIDARVSGTRLGNARREPLFRMPFDADGDGVRDLIVYARKDEIALHPCRLAEPGGDRLQLASQPSWRIDVEIGSSVRIAPEGAEMLVIGATRLLFVAFGGKR